MNWNIIKLQEVDSTNIYINKVEGTDVVVVADFQSSGKGQGTNVWESESGKNLLFSLKISPKRIPANKQYLLSMAGALAIKAALDTYASGFLLKWPNDIYWHDKKISGTLILTSISGKFIQNCIFGVGVNVNQKVFTSDAPNPVSLLHIIGNETDKDELLSRILQKFEYYYTLLEAGGQKQIITLYNESLYRRTGFYEYEDNNGRFMAEIVEVLPNGHLVLRDKLGGERKYELKEIKFII